MCCSHHYKGQHLLMNTTYLFPVMKPFAQRRAMRIAAPVEVTGFPSGCRHRSCFKQCCVACVFQRYKNTVDICLVPLPEALQHILYQSSVQATIYGRGLWCPNWSLLEKSGCLKVMGMCIQEMWFAKACRILIFKTRKQKCKYNNKYKVASITVMRVCSVLSLFESIRRSKEGTRNPTRNQRWFLQCWLNFTVTMLALRVKKPSGQGGA